MPNINNLYERYNTDNVFNRCVIIGLLDLLNNKMKYSQIWDNNTEEIVHVPFMYDFGSSDERFAQDNYTFFGESCFGNRKIDGKFDMLPRGIVKYNGSNIDASSITNRFVQGTYLKNENGRLTSYTSFMYSIPMTFNFEIEMWIDNMITAFKIEQAIRETFYKNKTFYVMFSSTKVNCCAGFPESSTLNKTVSYQFDTERQIKLNFSLVVETYQPVFDETTAIESSKKIENILFDVETLGGAKRDVKLSFKDSFGDVVYPSGSNVMIEWTASNTISDVCSLKLSYLDNDDNETVIGYPEHNHSAYLWRIPDNFTDFVQPTVIFNGQQYVMEEPIIKVVPNSNKIIDKDSFVIVNPGIFRTRDDLSLPVTVEYVLPDGSMRISDSYSINISNGSVDLNNPITITGDKMIYELSMNIKEIRLKLTYPLKQEFFTISDKMLII